MPVDVKRLFFLSLDPVHVGSGGYRLGRVDMTIVREPGTHVPKVPGTSLSGAARSYAAERVERQDAAGQHKNYKKKRLECSILYTFGTATPEESGNFAGAVTFTDARIGLFPVYSRFGPVWVTTEALLKEMGFAPTGINADHTGKVNTTLPLQPKDKEINIGWLNMERDPAKITLNPPGDLKSDDVAKEILSRIVVVSPKHFSHIVNSNLEVRTSVVINPETGAADKGGLFTYEAIPRATVLWNDIIQDDYANEFGKINDVKAIELGWTRPLDVALDGLKQCEFLGVGGMGTRGFGRIRIFSNAGR